MARFVIPRIALLSIKNSSRAIPRCYVPLKYQRSCFHVSWVLDVKGKPILMPSLSPTMETGTIVKWFKKEGDKIEAGDAIADIQTDKAVVTMEVDDDSVLAKIIVPEGTKDVKVGTLIALSVEVDEDWKSVEMPDSVAPPTAPPAGPPAPGPPVAGPPSPPPTAPPTAAPTAAPAPPSAPVQAPPPGQTNITMPALSPTMTTGTIVKWLKKEGDEVQAGDELAEIQTDKAVMSFEIEEECVLAKLLVPEGSQVELGELIAITVEKGMDVKSIVIPTTTKPGVAAPPAAPGVGPPAAAPPPAEPAPSGQVYGLAVKRLLEEYALNAASIKGTGRPNRLLKSDVLAYIQAHNVKKVPPRTAKSPAAEKPKEAAPPGKPHVPTADPSAYEDIKVSSMRAVIAKRLMESKTTIPHAYAAVDIKINKLLEIRSELKADGINTSVNDFITKAAAHALVECPFVNTLYQNGQIVRMPKVDISIAVATDKGLITPIVFDVPTKSVADISKNIKELAAKARAGRLKPEEFQGGTFTISNLGMFGIKQFSAIINPPQTGILAVGGGREELDAALQATTNMSTTLSYDRRAIDEDQAADFLAVLRSMLEDPTFLVAGRLRALRYSQD